ncbi:MAG TPA: OmpA family protein [Myxococcaceae bacterium]|nr:OmpA family protein [Myxococcaceae bacterium]
MSAARTSLAALLAAVLTACASSSKIRSDAEVIAGNIDVARRAGAMRCAPRELATAEANLEFARAEVSAGESVRAAEHLRDAEHAASKALELSKDCSAKPKQPLVVKIDGSDRDGDGIPDSADRCPDEPEDYDGFQDDDGCPDLDNDNDGVPDAQDRCPNTPGPASNAGCPVLEPSLDSDGGGVPVEYKRVVVKSDRIEIKQQIRFKTGSARISGKESFEVLKEVAQALRDNVRIRKLRIEGHTDSVGVDAANINLSQMRANAVMAELVKNGVEPSRMEAVGYGRSRPVASNTTASGRAQNRRTEFNIIEQ